MPHTTPPRMHNGFSLIELLIVILIISIVYFLGFEGVTLGESRPKALTPLNLKSSITQHDALHGAEATLLCVDKCHTCYLRRGEGGSFVPYKHAIDLNAIEPYTLDSNDALRHLEYGRYNDQKVCLKIDFYRNGSSTQLILKSPKGVYFLPAFFGEPQVVETLEDAQELWLKNTQLVANSGDFY